jgi:hypothetical protein
MSVFSIAGGNPALPTYPLQRSVRLRSSASAYFNRTLTTPTNNIKWTWSGWIKRGIFSTQSNLFTACDSGAANFFFVGFDSANNLNFAQTVSGTYNLQGTTSAVFRDPSSWYHVVVVYDSANATSTDRFIIYINGVRQTLTYSVGPVAQNTACQINSARSTIIGALFTTSAIQLFDGYLEEINFIDGQALTPSSFGAYNSYGVWSPTKYTGSYGTNGFYLSFQDNSALTTTANIGIGTDSSGNGNYWTSNNISITAGATYDSMLDVPTNTSPTNANFPVLNVIAGLGNGTYSDGNLAYLNGTAATWKSGVGSMGATSGKYYFEYTVTTVSVSAYFMVGAAGSTYNGFASYLGRTLDSWSFQWNGASSVKTNNDVTTTVSTAGSISVNDVLQVAIDLGTGSIWWGRNNTWVQGDPSAGTGASYTNLTGTILPGFAVYSNGGDKIAANFGQRPFTYTPPTGFNRLNTYNLPDSIVPVGAQYFAATLWTGTGVARNITNTVNGFSMQPDMVWLKNRNSTQWNNLHDSVRGANATIYSNATNAEASYADSVTGFNSTGFGVGTDSSGVGVNTNTNTYVGWQWRASNASAVTNTSGSISSQVSANQTAGFSIVTRTGTGANGTIGHGLGIAPKMIINKSRSNGAFNWSVYHANLTNANYVVYLDATNAQQSEPTAWNATAPTSTVFSVGTSSQTNLNAATYVSYCFATVPGYSAFGSYTGNGSTDGTFVFTGFLPRFVLTKRRDSTGPWQILDSSRDTYNSSIKALFPNTSGAEANFTQPNGIDFLSNGFKLRNTSTDDNASGGTYIYAAFAENPFKNSLAR